MYIIIALTSRLKLKPGVKGTKKLVKQYGDQLVCVRYRYDVENKRRYKTVEIIVEEKAWTPPEATSPKKEVVEIRIEYGEVELGRIVKAAGGIWNREKKVWELPYGIAQKLSLDERIISKSI